jgi:uncharacterized protein (DUF433 family)
MGIALPAQDTFGLGLYSYTDAARFIGARPAELRRWLKGYTRGGKEQQTAHVPLWSPQWAGSGIDGIGFRDLIELRFVRTFVAGGVPLNLIRRTIDEVHQQLGKNYPFTSTTFKTDGRRIFMELLDASGDGALVDVVKRQDVIRKVIAPSLREGIELSIDDKAERWFPLKGSRAVVFDPQRSFGQPILADSGVPTAAVAEALQAEGGDAQRVARLYGISPAEVRKASAFERRVAP